MRGMRVGFRGAAAGMGAVRLKEGCVVVGDGWVELVKIKV